MIGRLHSISGLVVLAAFCLIVSTNATDNCPAPSDPCEGVVCHPSASCQVDSVSGEPKCVCPSACTKIYQPVCGSDGKTYSNKCVMSVAACNANKTITKQYDGECRKSTIGPPDQCQS